MTKYEIILYWSDEDEAFIAEVPDLAGCAADGAPRQEALVNAEIAIDEWLETARERTRPIPEPKGRGTDPISAVRKLEYEKIREAYLRQPDSAADADDWSSAEDWVL